MGGMMGYYTKEDLIRDYGDSISNEDWYFYWIDISRSKTLSEEFIREFQDKVSWIDISHYQKLSEDFMRKFQDKINWACISHKQNLSEEFIKEFQDEVDWYYI